ncbi:MAG: hypothetical protein IT463_13835 [Planctomycetes bacterium]|nr:hypothetical protein [Planctomycetota bacterium]
MPNTGPNLGAAFPLASHKADGQNYPTQPGMTKRECAAVAIAAAIAPAIMAENGPGPATHDKIATEAVHIADAVLRKASAPANNTVSATGGAVVSGGVN